jgi:hypothetical protein
MNEFIETTWPAVASPSFLPPSALYQPREEKARKPKYMSLFFLSYETIPKTGMWVNPGKGKD